MNKKRFHLDQSKWKSVPLAVFFNRIACDRRISICFVYMKGGRYVEIDNAYIQSDITAINAEVSGAIQSIAVRENEKVAIGQLLFRIDATPFKVAEAKAQAQLQQVRLNILEQKAAYEEKKRRSHSRKISLPLISVKKNAKRTC